MRPNQLRAVALAAMLGLLLGPASAPAGSRETTPLEPIKIAAIFDITGALANYGTAQKRAVAVAERAIADHTIDTGGQALIFDVQDSASDAGQTSNLMQTATSNGSLLVIGPTGSGAAKKVDPIAVHAGLPVLAVSNTAQGITEMGDCVFRNSLAETQFAPSVIETVKRRWHPRTAAILYGDDDTYSKSIYDIYASVLPASGVKIVDVETFRKGDVDFKAQLTKIRTTNPDLIVYGAALEEGYKMLRQAVDVGLKAHAMTGNGMSSPRLISLAGAAADGLVFGAAWYPGARSSGNEKFVSTYHTQFGEDPDPFSAQAYAGVQIAAAAVKRAHPKTTAEMCQALRNVGSVDTILGRFRFSPTRDADAKGFVIVIDGGRYTQL